MEMPSRVPTRQQALRAPEPTSRVRRRPEIQQAIIIATWDLLASVGYHDLTIEGVAARAEVGKATIYRRWPSKGALVGEAIATHLAIGPEPDTGTSRGDLCASIQSTVDNYSGTIAGVVIPALVADLVHDPELLHAFQDRFLRPRRDASRRILERAIARGDLPADADIGLLLDIWAGAVFYRVLISQEPITPDLASRLTDLLLDGSPPRGTPKPPDQ
ncbi:MAG: TetR/AcrR family transcriptional regulator [Acidimicrobiales bacterium]